MTPERVTPYDLFWGQPFHTCLLPLATCRLAALCDALFINFTQFTCCHLQINTLLYLGHPLRSPLSPSPLLPRLALLSLPTKCNLSKCIKIKIASLQPTVAQWHSGSTVHCAGCLPRVFQFRFRFWFHFCVLWVKVAATLNCDISLYAERSIKILREECRHQTWKESYSWDC